MFRSLIPFAIVALVCGRPLSAADEADLFKKFEQTLTGRKLVGQFTIVGKETPPAKEEYTIVSVKKLPDGDLWLFTARIKYGDHDITLPMPLPVKWADKAPVITLDELTIPGLGTFSARVLIDNDRYAGTWSHGPVRGHLFGTIEKAEKEKDAPKEKGANEKE